MDTTRAIQVAVARADIVLCWILHYGRVALLALLVAAAIWTTMKRGDSHE